MRLSTLWSLIQFRIRGIDVFIVSVYCCVILRSSSTSDHPLVSHSFQAPSSVINDVAGDPFSSTLNETVGAFLIAAYSIQEGSARKATSFSYQA